MFIFGKIGSCSVVCLVKAGDNYHNRLSYSHDMFLGCQEISVRNSISHSSYHRVQCLQEAHQMGAMMELGKGRTPQLLQVQVRKEGS
mmetsp:Transcript_3992/g.5403  ORF Transcript_3992/g.5403 Transcript_3992/m.5403 type:complete len:87 (+) Transcript_3992:94-354(+)